MGINKLVFYEMYGIVNSNFFYRMWFCKKFYKSSGVEKEIIWSKIVLKRKFFFYNLNKVSLNEKVTEL